MAKNKNGVFSSYETAMFCDQIAMLLNSGITVNEGVFMLFNDMEEAKTRDVFKQVYDHMEEGMPLSGALRESGKFPEYMVHMVEVGENTGKLEDVCRSLSAYYNRESHIQAGIRSAIAYPVVLFTIMTIIIAVLAWKILPMFEQMFLELSSDVADTTQNVMNVGLTAGKIIAIITAILLVGVIAVLIYSRTKKGGEAMSSLTAGLSFTRGTSALIATGKFISSLSLMVTSGIEMGEALDKEAESCDNRTVAARIRECAKMYRDNIEIDEALKDAGLVTSMESRVINIAVKTGGLDEALSKLGEQYDERITAALSKLSSRIETILVAVLAVLVGAVLLSVMLPLVSMISSIG